jgi:hypothetical protein
MINNDGIYTRGCSIPTGALFPEIKTYYHLVMKLSNFYIQGFKSLPPHFFYPNKNLNIQGFIVSITGKE